MGQSNTHCNCCFDNDEMTFDSEDDSSNSNNSPSSQNSSINNIDKILNNSINFSNSPSQTPEQSTFLNLKSYVQCKNTDNSFTQVPSDNTSIKPTRTGKRNKQNTYKQIRSKLTHKSSINNSSNFFFQRKSNTFNPFEINTKIVSNATLSLIQSDLVNNLTKIILIQSSFRTYIFIKRTYPKLKSQLIEHLNTLVNDLYMKYLTPNLKQAESLIGIKHSNDSYKSLYSFNRTSSIRNIKLLLFTKLYILNYNNLPSFYVGEVTVDNILHGKGILTQSDGTKYNGCFENGTFTGVGQLFNNKGTIYEGCFNNGKVHGKASKKMLNGCIYVGDFVNGAIEGSGKEECKDFVYEGDFIQNKKNGKGKIVYKQTGDVYEGEFKEDKITGSGIYKWANGESYNGGVLDGKMHGKGVYKWPDGGEYEGKYVNNMKEGFGKFKWANGRRFEGMFKNGRPNGKGVLYIRTKEYDVVFKNGKIQGKKKKVVNKYSESEEESVEREDNDFEENDEDDYDTFSVKRNKGNIIIVNEHDNVESENNGEDIKEEKIYNLEKKSKFYNNDNNGNNKLEKKGKDIMKLDLKKIKYK